MPRREWEIPEREVTPKEQYVHRRRFLRTLGGLGAGLVAGCGNESVFKPKEDEGSGPSTPTLPGEPNPGPLNKAAFYPAAADPDFPLPEDRPLTSERTATSFNNFYEFSTNKTVHRLVGEFASEPWSVDVTGLVANPRKYDIDALYRLMPLEERIYRFRCVEAWAMTVPWTGFPMRDFIAMVEPLSSARYVEMTTFIRPQDAPGQWNHPEWPWPYTEGLTMAEATNELTMLVTGIYGRELPMQNGAPIRLAVPWKYGYKSIKSIVRINFRESRPDTFWSTLWPAAYPFESNVDPRVPHPGWSQEKEVLLDGGSRDSVIHNGYGEYVADLYA